MFNAKRQLIVPAVMACAISLGAVAVRADDASNAAASNTSNVQMQQKIDDLEAKVANLESAQKPAPTEESTAVQKVIDNSQSQGKLMDTGGVNTGWDPANGFHIGSDDGNFYLHPWLLFQFRGVMNYRASVPNNATNPGAEGEVGQKGTLWQTGFEVRRLEIGMDGHLWSPDFEYHLMFNTADGTGVPGLDDAYVLDRFGADKNIIVKAGQFADPVWHEDNVVDGNQMILDRSLVNGLIGGSIVTGGAGFDNERVQGVGVRFEEGLFHGEFDVHDGYNSVNSKFFDTVGLAVAPHPENFGISGRAEVKILGDDEAWKEYDKFSAMDDKQDVLVVGTGAEWTGAGDENDFFYTFDAQYDTAWGLGAYGAIYGFNDNLPKAVTVAGAPLAGHFDNSGFLVQAGYMLNKQIEPYFRWDLTHLDGKLSPQQHTTNEFTVGANYYMYGNRAKFSLDGSFLPSGPPGDADGLGILADQRHHEFTVRGQFQLEL